MMDFETSSDSESWSIFSITANISSSYVDTDKLLILDEDVFQANKYPIGMSNFRSKKKPIRIVNTLFSMKTENNAVVKILV